MKQELIDELTNDPLGRGYSGMSAKQAAESLNTANRQVNKTEITGGDLLSATVPSEFSALSADEKATWRALWSIWNLQLDNANTRGIIQSIFKDGTTTHANLIAFVKESKSRAFELGLGEVTEGMVERARA